MTRKDLSVELLRIWQHEPKTVLFVTHSISEAILLADQVVIISSRPGRVMRIIDIDIAAARPCHHANPCVPGIHFHYSCFNRRQALIFSRGPLSPRADDGNESAWS